MKYLLMIAISLAVMGGCASGSAKGEEDAKYSNKVSAEEAAQGSFIVDEEFDLLVAPEYDYETEVPYAEQIKNQPVKKQAKSAKKPAAVKQTAKCGN